MAVRNQLTDNLGRVHDNLRVSVTDRCNLRCFYCLPEGGTSFAGPEEILSFEEIERFVRIAVGLGVSKVHITGGEPLVRRGLPVLIRKLFSIKGIQDIALTTNGVLLAGLAQSLFEAGLRRINVHLDTLDRERFIAIMRRDELDRVLEGIEACRVLGYRPIKLNAVAIKGLTEPDIVPLARFGREKGIEVRFIEFMPLDAEGLWLPEKVLPASEIIDILRQKVSPLIEVPDNDRKAPAALYRYADGRGTVGFVASVTKRFCESCNRIRLTADGKLRYCLFALEETDIKTALRNGAPDEDVAEIVRQVLRSKWNGHAINTPRFVAPPRPMDAIGG